jgi:hypothetical protein
MKWAFIRSFLRGSSFFGVVAIVIAVSNAPIFQNVGLAPRSFERGLLVAYYIALTLALLMLFASKIFFELHCPDLIKENGSFERYLAGFPSGNTIDDQVRGERTAAWRTDNLAKTGRKTTSILLAAFIVFLPISFGLAAATLAQFAMTTGGDRPERRSGDIPTRLAPESAEKGEDSQNLSQAEPSSTPPLCSVRIESCACASRNPPGRQMSPGVQKTSRSETDNRRRRAPDARRDGPKCGATGAH